MTARTETEIIRRLTPRQRRVLSMYLFDGLTQQEIALQLGMWIQSVSKMIVMARERLRQAGVTLDQAMERRRERRKIWKQKPREVSLERHLRAVERQYAWTTKSDDTTS